MFKKIKLQKWLKIIFFPFVYILVRLKIFNIFIPFVNRSLKILGVYKQYSPKLHFEIFLNLANASKVRNIKMKKIDHLFIHLGDGDRGDLFYELAFAYYWWYYHQKLPGFLICNKIFPICLKERVDTNRTGTLFYCDYCYFTTKKVINSTGFPLFVLSSFINNEVLAKIKILKSQLKSYTKIEEIVKYKYEDMEIGRWCYINVCAYFGARHLTQNMLEVYKKQIVSTVKFYEIMKNFLTKIMPEKIFILNGFYSFHKVIYALSDIFKFRVVTFEIFERFFSLIWNTKNPTISLRWDSVWEKFKLFGVVNKEQVEKYMYKRMDINASDGLPYNYMNYEKFDFGEFVVLFTNIAWDSAVFYQDDIFEDYFTWLEEVVKFWENNIRDINLVIRIHPAEEKLGVFVTYEKVEDFLKIKFSRLPDNIKVVKPLDRINSYELIKKCRFALTYASSIGMEVAFLGKPCVVASNVHYADKGFVIKPRNKNEYFEIIKKLINNELVYFPDREKLYQYLYFFYFDRIQVFKGIKGSFVNGVEIIQKVEINSLEEFVNINKHIFDKIEEELHYDL